MVFFLVNIFLAIELSQPVLDILQHLAIGGQDIGQECHQDGLKSGDQKHRRQDQGLHVPGTVSSKVAPALCA